MRRAILVSFFLLLSTAAFSVVSAGLVYRNPRAFNVTYSFELVPDPAKIDRTKDLKLWLPIPREWDTQKAAKIVSVDPPPDGEYEDPEYGNPMLFWDFGKGSEQASYKAEIKFRLEAYEFHAEIEPERIVSYDKTSDEYKLYTRSTHTIAITPKVRELAWEAVGDENNPYLQEKRIIEFVGRKVRFKVLDFERGRGIKCMLDNPLKDERTGEEYYLGHCAQSSALRIALCRAVGIPARAVMGFIRPRPWTKEEDLKPLYDFETKLSPTGLAGAQHFGYMEPHTWTEFYIPSYGWIPVDGSRIRPLDHDRLVIWKGRDVKLGPHCPQKDSEGYGAPWVLLNDGRADMLFSGVWNVAKIHTARVKVLLTPDPFPADAYAEYAVKLYPEAKAERKLTDWRKEVLEWIYYKTRGHQDKHAALAAAYDKAYREHLVQYQQGPFVCHMLRRIIGDDKFLQIFGEYQDLRLRSRAPVSTAHFRRMAEDAYGKPLDWFFRQWAEEMELAKGTELPQLKLDRVTATKDEEGWRVRGNLLQVSDAFFRVPIELALDTEEGVERQEIWQDERSVDFELHTLSKPKKLTLDPDNDILKIQTMPPHLTLFWDLYPNIVVIHGTIAEADANRTAAERFDDEYLGLGHKIIKADTDVIEEDLKTECVVLFGRPATNRLAQQFKGIFPIEFDESKFTWHGAIYDQPTQGVAQVVDHPLNSKGLLILYAGLSGEATLQVCDSYLYDAVASYVIFDRDEKLLSGDWEVDSDLVWKFEENEY